MLGQSTNGTRVPSADRGTEQVSLLASDVRVCPYSSYQQLRSDKPVVYLQDQNIWLLTKYRHCEYVLSNPHRFSSREALSSTNAYRAFPKAKEILKRSCARPRARTLILADPPQHSRYRLLAQRALAPARTLKEFAPKIRAVVDDLLDRICEAGRCEIVKDFSTPLPMALIAHIFQVPQSEISMLKRWSDSFFAALSGYVSEDEVVRAAEDTLAFEKFILEKIAERRALTVDDFLGRLIAQPEGEEKLTDAEIVNICSQVLVGGNESTINFLSNLVYQIATTAGLQHRLAQEPDRIPDLLEENLRLEAPLQAMYRFTLEEEDFDGIKIPKGSKLMLNFGSANRDEEYYASGEIFDLDRDNRETIHLAFGRGIHACAGQSFARKEAAIAIEKLVMRLPNIRLSATLRPEPQTLFGVRGYRALHIEFDRVQVATRGQNENISEGKKW